MFKTIEWTNEGVRMVDQTRLPAEEVYRTCRNYLEVAEAIRSMVIRGAPAIGVAAAMGIALGVENSRANTVAELRAEFETIAETISRTRPTAVNLFWAVKRMRGVFENYLKAGGPAVVRTSRNKGALEGLATETGRDGSKWAGGSEAVKIRGAKALLVEEAKRVLVEDVAVNRALARHGAMLLENSTTVLTHCNAGALATGGYGTALGIVRSAVASGKEIRVFADETRPFLQGARLTAWELAKDGIPVTLITDSMAGHFMHRGQIQAVIVGADRIAANGDVANKIGTYTLAVLAHENKVPFYVAAPLSTVDLSLASGEQIPLEERSPAEVTHVAGVPIAPQDIEARHPAFDITPHHYVSAIVTERGIAREPFTKSLKALLP